MDVITIESSAYQELLGKVNTIFRYVKEQKVENELQPDRLIGNRELATLLGISTRTLQRMRSNDQISFKLIYGRCYYDLGDIEQAIRNGTLHCNPKTMKELRRNFKLRSTRLRGNLG